ncbi:MAG: hypothetical protein ACLUAO_00440 [Streptococcus sp.]
MYFHEDGKQTKGESVNVITIIISTTRI